MRALGGAIALVARRGALAGTIGEALGMRPPVSETI